MDRIVWRVTGSRRIEFPAASRGLYGGQRRIRILLLLEGASGIRHVADLDEFHAAGVRLSR